jgi:hypothetical protein
MVTESVFDVGGGGVAELTACDGRVIIIIMTAGVVHIYTALTQLYVAGN